MKNFRTRAMSDHFGSGPSKVIELFGLPGAGKTTITEGVAPDSGLRTRPEMSAIWKRQSLLQKSAFVVRALRDREWLACAFRLALRTPLSNPESLVRLVRLVVMKHWLRSQSGILLIDQGAMQSLWSIFYTERIFKPKPDLLADLFRSFYDGMAVQILVIDVKPEVAARRIEGRSAGSSRLDDLPEADVLEKLNRGAQLPEAIVMAARRAGFAVETLDGAAERKTLIKSVNDIISSVDITAE